MIRTIGNESDRALELATGSTRLLGIISSAFGMVMIVAFGYLNRSVRFRPYFILLGWVVWFAPGILFLASAYFLRRKSRPGAIVAMITTLFQSVCAAAILVAFCTLSPVSPIPIIMSVVWLAALGQLVVHLQRCLRAIQTDVVAHPGFAVEAPTSKDAPSLDA